MCGIRTTRCGSLRSTNLLAIPHSLVAAKHAGGYQCPATLPSSGFQARASQSERQRVRALLQQHTHAISVVAIPPTWFCKLILSPADSTGLEFSLPYSEARLVSAAESSQEMTPVLVHLQSRVVAVEADEAIAVSELIDHVLPVRIYANKKVAIPRIYSLLHRTCVGRPKATCEAERDVQAGISCYVTLGTQLCCGADHIKAGESVRVHVRCSGGKGGYGNTLRALGRKGGITDNVSDCRDLQGRRLRDVEAAQRAAEAGERKRAREAEEHEAKVARKAAQLASKKEEEQVQHPIPPLPVRWRLYVFCELDVWCTCRSPAYQAASQLA